MFLHLPSLGTMLVLGLGAGMIPGLLAYGRLRDRGLLTSSRGSVRCLWGGNSRLGKLLCPWGWCHFPPTPSQSDTPILPHSRLTLMDTVFFVRIRLMTSSWVQEEME